jgi:hypothetical protein
VSSYLFKKSLPKTKMDSLIKVSMKAPLHFQSWENLTLFSSSGSGIPGTEKKPKEESLVS